MAKMTFKYAKTDETYADYSRNFRMANSYAECEPIKAFNPEKHKPNLYEDIKLEGIQTPLALVELSKEESEELSAKIGRTIKFRVIRGHRRFRCIERIRSESPHMLETFPAQVHSGLSRDDEYNLMVDHAHVKGLNDYELFDAIRKLATNTRLSEEQIGHKVGRSRGYVQRRKWIMSLPHIVEENYRKRFNTDEEGKPLAYTNFTDGDLVKLNTAANVDREAGIEPGSDGSAFGKVWNVLETNGSTKILEIKAMSRKEILEKVQYFKDPIIKHIMRAIAGDPVNLSDAVDMLEALRLQAEQNVTA